MSLSMFNADQLDYMESLGRMAPETKCWCGWNRLGECHQGCPDDVTCADKMKASCPKCGNAPHRPGDVLTHRKGCKSEPALKARLNRLKKELTRQRYCAAYPAIERKIERIGRDIAALAKKGAHGCRRCSECDGNHHWQEQFDDDGYPFFACKHCPATKAWVSDLEDNYNDQQ